MSPQTKARVRQRADNRCEYCQLHQSDSPLAAIHIEHIIPRSHGGRNDPENLAAACIDCNLHKGPNLTGIDPQTDHVTSLFNPRRQGWDDHFEWRGLYIIGKTPTGRATVNVLKMNSGEQLTLRSLRA